MIVFHIYPEIWGRGPRLPNIFFLQFYVQTWPLHWWKWSLSVLNEATSASKKQIGYKCKYKLDAKRQICTGQRKWKQCSWWHWHTKTRYGYCRRLVLYDSTSLFIKSSKNVYCNLMYIVGCLPIGCCDQVFPKTLEQVYLHELQKAKLWFMFAVNAH